MVTCLVDNQEFETERGMHLHLTKSLKMEISEYYRIYHPRYDKFTHELINFKTKAQYLSDSFNGRDSLVSYLRGIPDDAQSTVEQLVSFRKGKKELKFAPSTVETRTSMLPSPALVYNIGLDYENICSSLGLVNRYLYKQSLTFDKSKPLQIICDSREQLPLPFDNKIISKLDVGDYCTRSHYKKVFVERKSLVDLIGSLSGGYERFKRELDRCQDMGCYLVICVESALESLLNYPLLLSSKIKASSKFVCSRMKTLCQEYENAQFLFVNNRIQSKRIIEKIFILENDIRNVDLQYEFDTRKL